MTAQVAADLRAAAEVLRRDGWTQHEFIDEEVGCKCALGAIVMAATDGDTARPSFVDSETAWRRYLDAKHAVRDLLAPHEESTGAVSEWNDDPDRTAAEVIATLEAAADAAEARA